MSQRLSLLGLAALMAGCGAAEPGLIPDNWIEGDALNRSLASAPGDPERGEAIFIDQDRGHCVLCHAVDGLNAPFQGNLGPGLTGVASRLSEGQIRLQVADSRRLLPDTIMPSYYRAEGLNQVASSYRGQPVLSPQEVEDLVAYLSTLTLDGA